MENFTFIDVEDYGVEDKPKGEKNAKGSNVGNRGRKRLADISNLPQQSIPPSQVENQQPNPVSTKDYVGQIHRENTALVKLLMERNKIVQLSGIELQRLRVSLQAMQQQNLQLAQANSQMLAELNSGKDRLKALQHELGCQNSLINALKFDLQAKTNPVACESRHEVATSKYDYVQAVEDGDGKPCKANKRQQSENQSLGHSGKQVKAEEKTGSKRRRQSARFKAVDLEPNEDFFEIDDAKFTVYPQSDDSTCDNGLTSSSSEVKEECKGDSAPGSCVRELQRSSIGRPLRQAAEKIKSYKETPINVKMRK